MFTQTINITYNIYYKNVLQFYYIFYFLTINLKKKIYKYKLFNDKNKLFNMYTGLVNIQMMDY